YRAAVGGVAGCLCACLDWSVLRTQGGGKEAVIPEGRAVPADRSRVADAFRIQTIRHTVLTDYTFKEAPLSENLTYAYERWLFPYAGHLHLQSPTQWKTFYAINNTRSTIDAHLHVHVSGRRAVSPLRAPFGSYQFAPAIQLVTLDNFVAFTMTCL